MTWRSVLRSSLVLAGAGIRVAGQRREREHSRPARPRTACLTAPLGPSQNI